MKENFPEKHAHCHELPLLIINKEISIVAMSFADNWLRKTISIKKIHFSRLHINLPSISFYIFVLFIYVPWDIPSVRGTKLKCSKNDVNVGVENENAVNVITSPSENAERISTEWNFFIILFEMNPSCWVQCVESDFENVSDAFFDMFENLFYIEPMSIKFSTKKF